MNAARSFPPFRDQDDRAVLVLNVAVAVLCTATQTALATVMSYITSASLTTFTLYTGIYLASMGGGVWVTDVWARRRPFGPGALAANGLIAVWLAHPGVGGLAVAYETARSAGGFGAADPVTWLGAGSVLCAVLGVVSGAELPFYSRWLQDRGVHDTRRVARFLASDYAGAFAGIVVFALIGNPFFGWMRALCVLQAAVLCVIGGCLMVLFSGRPRRMFSLAWFLTAVAAAAAWMITAGFFARHHGVSLL